MSFDHEYFGCLIYFNLSDPPSTSKKKTKKDNKKTYLQVIHTQLKEKHIQTLEDALIEAKDREKCRAIVQDPSFLADKGQQ